MRSAQVASCPTVTVVSKDEVDKEMLERERAIELQKPDLASKPENIRRAQSHLACCVPQEAPLLLCTARPTSAAPPAPSLTRLSSNN